MRHIVGVPNHVRAWSADVYRKIGGHRSDFSVGDDYELIVRTFLEAGFCRIAACGYTQYRNTGFFNHTNMRNALIQRMTGMASHHLTPKVVEHFKKIGFDYTVSIALEEPNLQPHPWWGRPELPWLSRYTIESSSHNSAK